MCVNCLNDAISLPQDLAFVTQLQLILGEKGIELFTGNTNMTLQNSFGLFIDDHFYHEDQVCYKM